MSKIISPNQAIDDALKNTCRILAAIFLPAFLTAAYRNLYVDYLPLHSLLITIIYFGFVALSFNFFKNTAVRLYVLVGLFLSVFVLAGYRNDSFLHVDMWLIFAGCILAFRTSYFWIATTWILAISLLLFLLRDSDLYPNDPFFVALTLHISSLLIGFIVFSLIKNVVSNYQELYEKQVEATTGLLEKNKQSYLLVEEAEETKEEERNRLRAAAFSLYSQIDRLTDLIGLSQKDADGGLLRSRLDEIKSDLHEFSENGKFISGETTDLTISDFTQVVANFSRPYSELSADSLNVSIVSKETNGGLFYFPMNFIKVLVHHLIEHCSEQYQATELKFEFHLGQKARSMQQIKLSLFIFSKRDFSEEEFSKLNTRMEGKRNLDTGDNHTSLIKTVLRRLSGTLKASLMGNAARYDISFWVD